MAASSASLLSTAATASVVVPSALSSARSSVNGAGFVQVHGACRAPVSMKALSVVCSNAEQDASAQEASVSRRAALSLLAAAASVGVMRASPAHAAYGEGANIFGGLKPETGFTTYTGDGFSFSLPSKWNPSKEVEYPGQVIRYEDNFDALTNLMVSVQTSPKSSIKDFGTPEEFLKSCSYLLGKQSYKGKTISEGGFDANLVSSANIFKAEEVSVKGKPYYVLSVLTRTNDGNEGGRHQFIVGTVSAGKLYIFKAQAGDKRWFKGAQKFVETAASSFTVA